MIIKSRKAHKTWQEIADQIGDPVMFGDKAVKCTRQAVQYYFKRRREKKIRPPMGMEPEPEHQPIRLAEPEGDVYGQAADANFSSREKPTVRPAGITKPTNL